MLVTRGDVVFVTLARKSDDETLAFCHFINTLPHLSARAAARYLHGRNEGSPHPIGCLPSLTVLRPGLEETGACTPALRVGNRGSFSCRILATDARGRRAGRAVHRARLREDRRCLPREPAELDQELRDPELVHGELEGARRCRGSIAAAARQAGAGAPRRRAARRRRGASRAGWRATADPRRATRSSAAAGRRWRAARARGARWSRGGGPS